MSAKNAGGDDMFPPDDPNSVIETQCQSTYFILWMHLWNTTLLRNIGTQGVDITTAMFLLQ